MTVGDICCREVVTANAKTNLLDIAKQMRQQHVGSVVITDSNRRPQGIVTDRDLVLEVLAEEIPLTALRVGDVMSMDPALATDKESIWSALQRMRQSGVRRSPVVDEQGCLYGILSVEDILEFLAKELGELTHLSNQQRVREETNRRIRR